MNTYERLVLRYIQLKKKHKDLFNENQKLKQKLQENENKIIVLERAIKKLRQPI